MTRTVGVEEEFLLLRRGSAGLVPAGDEVVEAAEEVVEGQFEHELKREQAELGTQPHQDLSALGAELRELRHGLAAGADRHSARLAALATSLVDQRTTTTPEARYHHMTEVFGRVARTQLTCGMHVHVQVDSREEGVAVVDRLRPWLAVLRALTASSPYFGGEDTGYASFRTVLWGQWPTAGVTEPFGSVEGYDAAREALVASGAALDDGMVYFDARLSARYPTVEIRVGDVCPWRDDAVTVATLARALVETASREWRAGKQIPAVRTELLQAATWRAARFGVEDQLVDVQAARAVPAWDAVGAMVDHVGATLDEADRARVDAGLRAIRERGTGARLQRESFAARQSLADVANAVVEATLR